MEATVIKIDGSLGLKFPEPFVEVFNLKPGSIVEINMMQNDEVVLSGKSKAREGWDEMFSRYAQEGEDEQLL
ncbi:MAG: hypothetical protein LBE56_01985 [Tannerella sp.]|jgi:antitoxin component of MazEF toxin-antitoxin module|nr:hypothetical protein [Tannerella sp.]